MRVFSYRQIANRNAAFPYASFQYAPVFPTVIFFSHRDVSSVYSFLAEVHVFFNNSLALQRQFLALLQALHENSLF
jgi:hypothetical protein